MESFLAVVEEGQFARAAQRLFRSPATVTGHVLRLEGEMGAQLLRRSPVALTPAGERLVPHARTMLAAARAATALARDLREGDGMPLRVGVMIPGAAELTPAILRAFGKAQPRTRLTVESLNFTDHVSALIEHRVDVAFVRPAPQDERITTDVLALEPRVIIAPAASELAAADGLHVSDIPDLAFVGLPETTPKTFIDYVCFAPARNGTPARWTPDVAATGPAVVTSVAAGQGLGTTLYSMTRFYRSPGVCFVPVLGVPWEASALITRKDDPRPEVRAFRSLAATLAHTLGPKLLPTPKLPGTPPE